MERDKIKRANAIQSNLERLETNLTFIKVAEKEKHGKKAYLLMYMIQMGATVFSTPQRTSYR